MDPQEEVLQISGKIWTRLMVIEEILKSNLKI